MPTPSAHPLITKRTIHFILAFLALASGCLDAAASNLPNIVYILTDQWRASATGYAGDPNVKTPNLDRLAGTALNFRNAVSVCPVCTPHRAALMTGRFPTSTGMFLNDAHLPENEICMAEILGEAGYDTAYIGKWHLDGHGRAVFIPRERRQGWDYWKVAECDHDYNHSHYYTGDSTEKRFWKGYDAFAQTEDARQYLHDHAGAGKPFILFVAYGGPHFPHHTAPEEYKKLYPPEGIKLPPNVPADMQAAAKREAQGYYAHCSALDHCVGELIDTLEETGLMKNTILVFTSDHGEMLGSHDAKPKTKQVPWSESSLVPFLMKVPGIAGRTVETPITTPEILPTLLGLSGVRIPSTVEGEDLSAIVRSGEDPDRAALYMNVAPFMAIDLAGEYRAIRTTGYTYVRALDGPWLLFDNKKDPWQMHNLVSNPEKSSLVQKIDLQLSERLKQIGDDFRPARTHIEEWGYQGIPPHGSVPYSSDNDHKLGPQTPRRKRQD